MEEELAFSVFATVLQQIYKEAKTTQFSFDKMQSLFGKAYNRMIPTVKEKLSAFASESGMDHFSAKLDEFLVVAENKRLIYAAGGNRNKFQVSSLVLKENQPVGEHMALVAKFYALSVVDVLKTKEKGRSF